MMTSFISKKGTGRNWHLAILLWVLKWLLLLLSFFLVCSKPTLSLTPLGSLTHGGDIRYIDIYFHDLDRRFGSFENIPRLSQ